ncbi:hypothetical protein [Burkholderia stagnalis]|uniref:hypothetical protein n=1 Tax=Burkholderia stagnalis TaxID=1503054 RepID=UPI000A6DB202|nr:hypothetical protein [Burkholderia stagnalis]
MRNFNRLMLRTSLCAEMALGGAHAIAAGLESDYQQLPGDISVSSTQTVLTSTITLAAPIWVYTQSDGRVFPSGAAVAAMSISADGKTISNNSIVDWSKTTNAQQHSINVIGATYLGAGTHILKLTASTLNGAAFNVGAGTNLSVMTSPAQTVSVSKLSQDTATLSFDTSNIKVGTPLPNQPLLSQTLNAGGQATVALASGRAFLDGAAGDPLTAIYLNGLEPASNIGSWADNDTYQGAENQSPFFNHAFYSQLPNQSIISWNASALPYCEDGGCSGLVNNVKFKVGADSTLITLSGGMSVTGAYSTSASSYNRTNYIGVGSTQGWPGVPATGTDVALAQTQITIPAGHNGIVLVSGKSRVQGDESDQGGTVSMWISIDGVKRGSTGIQQIAYPNGASTRTIGASYLSSAPAERLAPGSHTITLYGRADGNFKHLSMTRDLPLIWFD